MIFPELKIELGVSEPLLGVLITVELLTSLLTNFAAIPPERRLVEGVPVFWVSFYVFLESSSSAFQELTCWL